jgi:hypothetical protein
MLIPSSGWALLTLLSALFGCLTEENLSDPTASTEGGNATIRPADGRWSSDDLTETENTCSASGSSGDLQTLTMQVTNNPDASFYLEIDSFPFDCTIAETSFTCARLSYPYEVVGTSGVTFTDNIDLSGTLESSDRFDGELSSTTECAGSSCSDIASANSILFPCSVHRTFSAQSD